MAAPTVVTKYQSTSSNPVDEPLQAIEYAINELANLCSKAGGFGAVISRGPVFTNDTVFQAAILAAVQNRIPDVVSGGVNSSGDVQP